MPSNIWDGHGGVRTLKVALLAADGVDGASLNALCLALVAAGAVPNIIAPRLGHIKTVDGALLEATGTLENSPSGLFEALVLPDGEAGVALLAQHGQTREIICKQYHQGKTILSLGVSKRLLVHAGLLAMSTTDEIDPGILLIDTINMSTTGNRLLAAMARQRYQRTMQYDEDEG